MATRCESGATKRWPGAGKRQKNMYHIRYCMLMCISAGSHPRALFNLGTTLPSESVVFLVKWAVLKKSRLPSSTFGDFNLVRILNFSTQLTHERSEISMFRSRQDPLRGLIRSGNHDSENCNNINPTSSQ